MSCNKCTYWHLVKETSNLHVYDRHSVWMTSFKYCIPVSFTSLCYIFITKSYSWLVQIVLYHMKCWSKFDLKQRDVSVAKFVTSFCSEGDRYFGLSAMLAFTQYGYVSLSVCVFVLVCGVCVGGGVFVSMLNVSLTLRSMGTYIELQIDTELCSVILLINKADESGIT